MTVNQNVTKELDDGTPASPWQLKTPPQMSDYTMHHDRKDERDVIVCTVGNTVLQYDARCIDDLHAMLSAHADWVELGSAHEQKPAKSGTVEALGRSPAFAPDSCCVLKAVVDDRFLERPGRAGTTIKGRVAAEPLPCHRMTGSGAS